MQTIGASWDATLDSFLGNGGVIIVCTFGGSTHSILTGAGLMSITSINPISYQTVYCVDPADRLAESVSSSFTAPNGALRFVTGEGNVVFNNGTSPVVIHKTVGYGQIALIGFDYFMSNSDADRVLGNAIRLYALPERAYLTVRGSNNGIYYRTYDLTTETWNSWTDAPGSTPDPPAVAVLGKGLHLVVRGATAGQIWHGTVNLNDNSFSGWSLFDGATPSAPALAANSTHLCMVVRGYNDAIYYRFYSLAADTWGAWQVVPAGTTLSTPGVAMAGNELHFAVRGSNNNEVWHSYINTQTGSFSGWTLLDGTTPSPPLLTGNNQRVCLVVRGDNNGIYYRWLNLRTKVWDDWTGFPFGMTPDVPAATLTGNNLQIVVRGMNNDQIWHGTLRAGAIGPVWSGWTLLDGSTPSKPVLAS